MLLAICAGVAAFISLFIKEDLRRSAQRLLHQKEI
jgi:hypothetical protein